jgi:hypothetical protein
MPKGAPTLDHVPRRSADGAHERTHVIRLIKDRSLASEVVDVRRLKLRVGVVNLEIQRRLVVDDDEENVRPLGLRLSSNRGKCA